MLILLAILAVCAVYPLHHISCKRTRSQSNLENQHDAHNKWSVVAGMRCAGTNKGRWTGLASTYCRTGPRWTMSNLRSKVHDKKITMLRSPRGQFTVTLVVQRWISPTVFISTINYEHHELSVTIWLQNLQFNLLWHWADFWNHILITEPSMGSLIHKANGPPLPSPRPFALCFNNPINDYGLLAYWLTGLTAPGPVGSLWPFLVQDFPFHRYCHFVRYFQMWTEICLPGAPLQILQRQSSCVKCRTHRLCKMSLRSCVKVLTR